MARSGLKWVVADAALCLQAQQLINRRHAQRGFLKAGEVYQFSGMTTTYVVTDDDRVVATASLIQPDQAWLPCMATFPEVDHYFRERSTKLGRPAKLVEVGGLGTDEESVRYILAVMRNLPPEIVRANIDDVFVDVLPEDAPFYRKFWGLAVFGEANRHAKDGLPAVCMHYDVRADPQGWLQKFGQGGEKSVNPTLPPAAVTSGELQGHPTV